MYRLDDSASDRVPGRRVDGLNMVGRRKTRRSRALVSTLDALVVIGAFLSSPPSSAHPLCTNWQRASTEGPARVNHALAFDEAQSLVVLFGGSDALGGVMDETWLWDGTLWFPVAGGLPPAREGHAMAYDQSRGVTVLFGGRNGGVLSDDTWEWNTFTLTWTEVVPTGVSPPARADSAMAFDPQSGRIMLFGGTGAGSTLLGDTWYWDGSGWTLESTTGPEPRSHHSMAGDPGEVVLFGGNNGTADLGDTWTWTGGAWQLTTTMGPTATSHSYMAYSDSFGIMLLTDTPKTWLWVGDWVPTLDEPGRVPPRRTGAAMATGPGFGTLVLHGGVDDAAVLPETWRMNWTNCIPAVSTWGVVILTLLFLVAGTLIFPKKRASDS